MYETLRGYEVPWQQAELVHRQTEGNPLFVQEVLRYLVEEGIVVREQGTYVVRGDATAIPDGLRDVIGRRLSHLDEKTNAVLSIAAVIGRDFRLDVLQKVAGLTEDELYAALEQASEHAIVEQRPAPGGVAFRFTHAMFRTLLYEEIFAPRRIRLHQQVGRAFEEVYARRLEEHAAELAEHFTQSTETGDLQKAVRYGELAAQRAMSVYAHGEAVRHLEQAVRAQEVLDPDDQERRCTLLLNLGAAVSNAGEPLRYLEDVGPQALELAEKLGDPEQVMRACQQAFEAQVAASGAGGWGRQAIARWAEAAGAAAKPDTPERVIADTALGRVAVARGQPELGRALLTRALELARELHDNRVHWSAATGWIDALLLSDSVSIADPELSSVADEMEDSS
jgi:predicted ATPase